MRDSGLSSSTTRLGVEHPDCLFWRCFDCRLSSYDECCGRVGDREEKAYVACDYAMLCRRWRSEAGFEGKNQSTGDTTLSIDEKEFKPEHAIVLEMNESDSSPRGRVEVDRMALHNGFSS